MKMSENKMMLKEADAAVVQKVHGAAVAEYLNSEKPMANVVGLGVGVKWKNGESTGEPAMLVLVTHKVQ